jgi:hypothetical protein
MTVIFIALALICYLAFLIDWKELRGVLSQGGWGAICLYVVIGILICAAWVTPTVVAATEIGH